VSPTGAARCAAIAAASIAAAALPAAAPTAGRDETRLAFVRFAPELGRLRILTGPLAGGPRRPVRLPLSDVQGPAWSPDGQRIAFVGGVGVDESGVVEDDVDLYVASRSGRELRRLTTSGAREASPAWSPDGARIAYVVYAGRGNRSSLHLVDPRGSRPRRLTYGNVDLQPSWSPDGRRLVFVRITARFEAEIWEVRRDGTGLRHVLPGLTGATQPTWSPDGSRLLLTDGRTLFTVQPDGGGRRLVTRLSTDARGGRVDPQPSWSRSGWIVFRQLRASTLERSDIWRVRPDGSGLERVTRSPSADSEPATSP
jgi:TolB protein